MMDTAEFYDLLTWLNEKCAFDRIINFKCVTRIRMALTFIRWRDRVYGDRYRKARYDLMLNCQANESRLTVHSMHCL